MRTVVTAGLKPAADGVAGFAVATGAGAVVEVARTVVASASGVTVGATSVCAGAALAAAAMVFVAAGMSVDTAVAAIAVLGAVMGGALVAAGEAGLQAAKSHSSSQGSQHKRLSLGKLKFVEWVFILKVYLKMGLAKRSSRFLIAARRAPEYNRARHRPQEE
jgi:hypothetical protein